MLFYAFESSLLPWECTDHENVTINILNWLLFDRFFMLYDSIFFTWFAKRFWVHPFYFNVMPTLSISLSAATIFCSQLLLVMLESTAALLSPSLLLRNTVSFSLLNTLDNWWHGINLSNFPLFHAFIVLATN